MLFFQNLWKGRLNADLAINDNVEQISNIAIFENSFSCLQFQEEHIAIQVMHGGLVQLLLLISKKLIILKVRHQL